MNEPFQIGAFLTANDYLTINDNEKLCGIIVRRSRHCTNNIEQTYEWRYEVFLTPSNLLKWLGEDTLQTFFIVHEIGKKTIFNP